jgi:hypothetical protein
MIVASMPTLFAEDDEAAAALARMIDARDWGAAAKPHVFPSGLPERPASAGLSRSPRGLANGFRRSAIGMVVAHDESVSLDPDDFLPGYDGARVVRADAEVLAVASACTLACDTDLRQIRITRA